MPPLLSSPVPSQDLAKLNPAELTPLTPEVISRQATINIGARPHTSAAGAAGFGPQSADRSMGSPEQSC